MRKFEARSLMQRGAIGRALVSMTDSDLHKDRPQETKDS